MRAIALLTAWMPVAALFAQDAQEAAVVDEPPEQVLVVGEQPGPPLWKVVAGDHVLWLMGGVSPLPRNMIWRSHDVERAIAGSQQVLANLNIRTDVGFFAKLSLLPSLISVRDNPDKQKLADVVPADLYARWLKLKQRYLPRNDDVESWRPIFAAQKLYAAAIDKSGMTGRSPWWDDIEKLAKQHHVPRVPVTIELDVEKPRAVVKQFKKAPVEDIECFRRTLDRLENDIDTMRLRANAWAVGDVATIQRLPFTSVLETCADAVLNSGPVQQRGWQDLPARVATTWIDAAEAALRRNASTFAVLPIDEILKSDGWVSGLVARGYTLESPDD